MSRARSVIYICVSCWARDSRLQELTLCWPNTLFSSFPANTTYYYREHCAGDLRTALAACLWLGTVGRKYIYLFSVTRERLGAIAGMGIRVCLWKQNKKALPVFELLTLISGTIASPSMRMFSCVTNKTW